MDKKIVVITGCLGFIGQHLTKACLEKGWKVYGVDKKTYAADQNTIFEQKHRDFELIEEDICDLKILPDCNLLFNLAAESHVGNSIVCSSKFVKTNVDGVRNLLELIKAKPLNYYGKPLLIHLSTDEVYGDLEHGTFTESSPLEPSNPYSATKAAGDMLIKAWSRTNGLDYIIVRPTNNYGTHQYFEKLIPMVVKILSFNKGKKIPLHNGGEPIRSWLHVEDTVNALMTIVDNTNTQETCAEVYNIGGEEQKNKEVVRKIVNSYIGEEISRGWSEEHFRSLTTGEFNRPGQDIRYSVDDSKLRALGWTPHKIFDEEIAIIVDYYKEGFRW